MTYTSVRCPHCNYSIYYGPSRAPEYNSILKQCPNLRCRKLYEDSNCREIAISGPWPRDKGFLLVLRRSWALIIRSAFFIGGLMSLLYATTFGLVLGGLASMGFGVYSLFKWYKDVRGFKAMLEEEMRKSEERLKDPDYSLALRYYGHPVPDKYIAPDDLVLLKSKGL